MTNTLLVELLTEELPPKALSKLGGAFASHIHVGLGDCGLVDSTGTSTFFATPRRLAVTITNVLNHAPDRSKTKKLMPSKVAFGSDGTATATLLKRLEKENATKNQLERRREGDTEYVFLNQTVSGLGLPAALQMALDKALAALPVPKKMRYQIPRPSVSDIHLEASTSERRSSYAMDTVEFVRPAHGLVALHGENIVKVTALGLEADRVTRGHRVLSDKPLVIRHAEDYERVLREEGKVEASYITRRERVKEELQRAEKELARKAGQKPDGRIPVGVRSFVIDTERAEHLSAPFTAVAGAI